MRLFKIFLLAVILPFLAGAQVPRSYSAERIQQINLEYRRLLQDWDVVITPIERQPMQPSLRALAIGNWGNEWSGTTEHYDEIYQRAQRQVVIFIIDTAPFFTHPALDLVAWNELGRSYTNEPTLQDGNGHGHHVAGIIGAVNEEAPLGLAAALANKGLLRIVPMEALNDDGAGSYNWIISAIDYVRQVSEELQAQGYAVMINMSLGGPSSYAPLETALERARQAGIFIAAASGNTYSEGIDYPARSPYVQAIGSIDSDGKRSSFSTWGQELFMTGPGRNILSTWPDGTLINLSGTSMGTPSLLAMAAIIASVYSDANADQIQQILIETATDLAAEGWDPETGYGSSMARKILDWEPAPEPEPEPEPEGPTRSRRIVATHLPGPYEVIYQTGGGMFKTIQLVDLELEFKTKKYDSEALEEIRTLVKEFFIRRAITITKKEDQLRAGYWGGRFLEIYLRKEHGIRANLECFKVWNPDANKGYPDKPGVFDFLLSSKRTTFKY